MNKYESNKIEKILKAVCAKIARWVGRLANRPSSSTDKFVSYQEHMGKGLTLEIREQSAGMEEQSPEMRKQALRIERQKIAAERQKVAAERRKIAAERQEAEVASRKATKRLQFALKLWGIISWIGGITAIFLILYTLLGK